MRKAVIQNKMALDMLTAAQGGTCVIIKVECCGNVSAALHDMKNQVKAMSNEKIPALLSREPSRRPGLAGNKRGP